MGQVNAALEPITDAMFELNDMFRPVGGITPSTFNDFLAFAFADMAVAEANVDVESYIDALAVIGALAIEGIRTAQRYL